MKLAEMIEALRVELAVAVDQGDGQSIRFDVGPIELEVEVAATKKTTGKAGVEFWVITAGADRAREDVVTQRIKITLQPKPANSPGPVQVASLATDRPSFPPRS
jgi:hypothetical protein